MNDNKLYDLTTIKSVSRNKADLFNTMILLFINNSTNEIKNLEKNIKDQNIEQIRTTIHKIKPSFAYIGLSDLIGELSDIRTEALNNNFTKCLEIFDNLKSKLDEIIIELKKEIL